MKVSPYEKAGNLQALLKLLLEAHDVMVEQLGSQNPNELSLALARSSVERIRMQYEEAAAAQVDYGYLPREVNNESA
mgnify:CR=1 FL=1